MSKLTIERKNLLLLAGVVIFLLVVTFQSVEFHLTSLTQVDDSFYYLGYARNIAAGNGPTFDGLIETNGVQPLWAVLLVAIAKFFPEPITLMHVSMVVAIGLAVISAFAMSDILRHFFDPPLRTIVMTFYIAFIATPQIILSGMETTANLAVFTLALAAVLRIKTVAFFPIFSAGILIGLACLARVDNLIITPAFAALMLWSNGALSGLSNWEGRKKAAVSVFWLALPVIVIFGGYVLFNIANFERILPISGEIKSANQAARTVSLGGRFGIPNLVETTQDAAAHYAIIVNNYLITPLLSFSVATLIARYVLIIAVIVLAIAILRHRKQFRLQRIALSRMSLAICVIVGGIIFLHTWAMFFQLGKHSASPLNWYYIPEYVFFTVFLGFLLRAVSKLVASENTFYRVTSGWLTASLIISCIVFCTYFVNFNPLKPLLTHYEATLWANENLPDESVIGSFNSGVIGYFSDASVINLDGLMNNEEILQVALGERSIYDYIKDHRIDVIMDFATSDWTPETVASFRGIPTEDLELVYQAPFDNYDFVPSTYYVFLLKNAPIQD